MQPKAKSWSETLQRGKDTRCSVEAQPIMFEALRGQKIDFQNPDGVGTE
jgi:hypothetical protein